MSTDPPASRHRIAVVESDPELRAGSEAWERLAAELGRARPDLLVLNELPFGPWLAARERFDADAWQASIADHEAAIAALPQLGPPAVIGTRPAVLEGRRCNQAFLWTREGGLHYPHTKQHIPDSPGYRETTWTAPGPQRFATADLRLQNAAELSTVLTEALRNRTQKEWVDLFEARGVPHEIRTPAGTR